MISRRELYQYCQNEGKAGHHQEKMHIKSMKYRTLTRTAKEIAVRTASSRTVLDVGCAEGWYTTWMAEKAVFAVGMDLSLPKLKRAIAESNRENTSYVLADWDYIPFRDGSFGATLFLEGPEHSLAPSATLAEISRVTSHSGYLVLSSEVEPDGFYTRHVRAYFRSLTNPFSKPFDGHVRIVTPNTLKEIIPAGYKIEQEVRQVPSFSFPLKRTLERHLLGKRQYAFTILVARKVAET
jgi:ubiquinone/menaquinone biosynthesis C-methylase UbiE